MRLIEINKEQLNSYSKTRKHPQFLQSWEWAEFQKSVGREVFCFGVEDNGEIKFAFSAIKNDLSMDRSYIYIPRTDLKFDGSIIKELKKKFPNLLFVRIEPKDDFRFQISDFRINKSVDVQASKTSIVDISGNEDEILKSFHQKTRYNIRLAKKKGVEVRVGRGVDFERFWQIMQETNERDGFRTHSKEYYKKQLEIDFFELLVAEYEGEIIAANIVSYFGGMASYVHGASSNQNRNVMAPFALQWFSIERAKQRGCNYYDLNGIDEEKWPGVTRFKRGFKGEELEYPGCYDVVFDVKFYYLYKVLRWGRRAVGRIINK